SQPVFLADSGRVKVIETALGTGDGFCRAMKQLNLDSLAGKKFTVFGFGKVGLGITLRLLECGCSVTVVEAPEKLSAIQCCPAVSYLDRAAVNQALADSYCAVTATGRADAAGNCADFEQFFNSPLLLANMGVEDEFGASVPAERVLNHKKPLNFILQEPTKLKYIDPTMALHNLGAELLCGGKLPPGIHEPDAGTEEDIIRTITTCGVIGSEINKINLIYGKNVLEE
ncbi:MAG: NAD(P)-dependent oxidoreductase, partial [Victivallaceae bacterium]